MKKKYKPIPVSKLNTSRKPSKAKKESLDREKRKDKAGRVTKAKKPKNAKITGARPYSFKLSALNPQTPKQLPETELSRKGLTLRKLLRGTPRLMMNNSIDVELVEFKRVKTKSGMPAIKAVVVTNDPFRPGKVRRVHNTFIIGADKAADNSPDLKTPINKHKKVIVSCACESYVFTFEYANAAYGASRIVYGNGEPPVVTNPNLAFGLCKHLVAVATRAIKQDV